MAVLQPAASVLGLAIWACTQSAWCKCGSNWQVCLNACGEGLSRPSPFPCLVPQCWPKLLRSFQLQANEQVEGVAGLQTAIPYLSCPSLPPVPFSPRRMLGEVLPVMVHHSWSRTGAWWWMRPAQQNKATDTHAHDSNATAYTSEQRVLLPR